MAYTTINKSTEHFNTVTYSGNNSTSHAITGVGHQPDLVWLKNRGNTADHQWHDSVRGKSGSNYYYIQSNQNYSQGVQTDSDGVNNFDTDGFTVGYSNSTAWNKSTNNYVAWNWKANGSGSANNDGATTSTVSVNNTAGFSIVKWQGTSGNTTVGHGMNTAPVFTIVKNYDANGQNWIVYHKDVSPSHALKLNLTSAKDSGNNYWQSTAPTNSLLTFTGGTASNANDDNMIAYCFAEKTGYSKFGSYVGNGSSDGSFCYLGFKPAFTILKRTDATGGWIVVDNKRDTFNVAGKLLYPGDSSAEQDLNSSHTPLDFLSNGMKMRSSNLTGTTSLNISGATYIYMAFAEAPLVGSNNVPCTAR